MHNLVGQTVAFPPLRGRDSGNKTRTLYIYAEILHEGRRYYLVNDTDGSDAFYVCAKKYDEFFLQKKSLIKNQPYVKTKI